jgi:hypothetical protein
LSLRRALAWIAAGVLVVLLGRTIGYAAVPSPAAGLYAHKLGGPTLPEIALVAMALGGSVAVAICWLASLGVRERRLLERRVLSAPAPVFRPGRVVLHALALWAICAPTAGLVEAYIHWRAGLGWHGLHCLVGPVHRDLLPIVGALALVAAAAIAAADHVLAWMRRTFALLGTRAAGAVLCERIPLPVESQAPRERFRAARAGARAPPPVARP